MKLSALVFLALLGLAEQKIFEDNVKLEWVFWPGSLPNDAVSIYNHYTHRRDYVCKSTFMSDCHSGFYSPKLGPYCHYPSNTREVVSRSFKILINKDNFEFLEWKWDSDGKVPRHSVKTCSGSRKWYVGKNKYGLGKVDVWNKKFYLPWEGKEYWYHSYQVLTINKDAVSEHISDVKYKIDEAKIIRQPPATMRRSQVTNNGCRNVVKTVSLSKTTEVENSWNIGSSTMVGVTTGITAGIPLIGSANIEVTLQQTLQFDKGTTKRKSETHSVEVQVTIPPNHSCTVRMEGRQIKADIPYTARLSRTYRNGKTRTTSIVGKYTGVQTGEVRAVVDRCKPVANAKPCP